MKCRRRLASRQNSSDAVAAATSPSVVDETSPARMAGSDREQTLCDKFWIWTHVAGSHNEGWNIPGPSHMTPVEGAAYLDVPNLIFVRYRDQPKLPLDPYAIAFRPMKRVVWSITGADGRTSDEERRHVLGLARRFENTAGFIMDDFFHPSGEGALPPKQLEALRGQLVVDRRRLPLYVVVYRHQLELPIQDHLKFCDKITFWTWTAGEIEHLEKSFARLGKVAPDHGKLLGCYMWDYDRRQAMPLELMKKQCNLGLRLLRTGRIEGMIFLASNICDLQLPAVEYTRRWIADVGPTAIGA